MSDVATQLSTALAGRYRIGRELGAGGMATVYLAQDLRHDRKVAIKVLKPELAAVLGADRFVVEIKTTASLQHPHILPLFDSGTADGFLFYVMPYIEGETIRDKLNRETQFGVDEAVRIAREVADALDYAHRHGVIHRDIKPENILLHDGRAMVMDFGIALAVSAAAGGRMTETGLSLGTPHYMSPEQATAEKEISGRSDVYSLASVLFEMLAGQPPHLGGSAQQIIMKIIAEPVEAVTKFRKSVPPNVAAAVAKALEKLPADRFETAKSFADALANPAFVAATDVATASGAKHASGMSPRLYWIAAAMALVTVGDIAVAVWSWRRPDAPREVTRLPIALPDSQPLSENNEGTRVAISPDGRTIVYVGGGAKTSSTRLYVRRLDQLDATPLAGTDGARTPAFSPDGTRIAFVNESRTLQVIATGGGPISPIAGTQVAIGGLTWASDGYIYYTPYDRDESLAGPGLARVRDTGGKPEPASTLDTASGERVHTNPSALPNGRGVIIAIGNGRGAMGGNQRNIGVLDAKTRKVTVLVQGALLGRYAASGHFVYVTRGGIMMAQPFDADRLHITGDAVPIADRVSVGGPRGADVAVSQTGTLAYVSGSRGRDTAELVWVARDGKATPVDSQFVGRFGRARLSPDGRQVAVTIGDGAGAGAVWVKQLDRGSASKVLENAGAAAWSPDGKTLVAAGSQGFVLGPANGSRLPTSISAGTIPPENPEWSSDGKWFMYHADGDIYAMATSGDSAKIPLVTGRATQRLPALSPDGRWLAYASVESGHSEVYVQPFPDTRLTKRTVSVAGGDTPRWSRNGRELFFVDASRHMVAVPISPGSTFVAGSPLRLFDVTAYGPRGSQFDVAADGRFLMTRSVGAAARPDELILVQNFFEELKAKVKPK